MIRTDDIPKDVWDAANAYAVPAAETATRNLDYDDVSIEVQAIFFSIARAILAERERCAKVADEIGAGRSRQSSQAKSAKKRAEARDFESMAISAIDVGYAIRKGGE